MPTEEREKIDLLAFRYVAGEMHPQEAERFESRLADDQSLREAVCRAVALSECLLAATPTVTVQPPTQRTNPTTRVSAWAGSRQFVGPALAILATLLLAVGLKVWSDYSRSIKPIVAWIERAAAPPVAVRTGDRIEQLDEATTVRFQNGVRLSASGDADVEVLSATALHLHTGRIQVDVGELGSGFAVSTESTRIVDLGTVFGVGVNRSQETDVVVFQGEVALNRPRVSSPPEQNLNTGEAVRVQSNGDRARIPMVWHDPTTSQWSTDAAYRGSSLFTAVSDNLATSSRPKFYAIVPKGFREDAKVYVDRRYEWNGLDEFGLPAELIGGDYIRTFNDDKAQENLEIVVTLAGPADLYVLIDERYPVPDWLASDFTQTEFLVGIDLGTKYGTGDEVVPPLGVNGERWLGVGPGRSVDVPVVVWKREVDGAGQVRFGPLPSATLPSRRGSMYGIVAVPAKAKP